MKAKIPTILKSFLYKAILVHDYELLEMKNNILNLW